MGHSHAAEQVKTFSEKVFQLFRRDVLIHVVQICRSSMWPCGHGYHPAHELEARLHCPEAEIVYELFRVVSKYGREVIDRVRVDEANRLRHDRTARRVIKGSGGFCCGTVRISSARTIA